MSNIKPQSGVDAKDGKAMSNEYDQQWSNFESFIYDCLGDGFEDEVLSCMEDGIGEYAAIVLLYADDWERFPLVCADHPIAALFCEDDQGFKSVDLIDDEAKLTKLRDAYAVEVEAEADADAED
jgi:hypothetical protein